MEKSRVSCSLLKFFCDEQKVNPSSRTDSSIFERGHLDKLHMSDSLLFINCLGQVIVAVEPL